MTAVIEASALTKFYGKRRGVEDVNLLVRQGEVFGFLGPNGSGKTTTIRMMLDHIRPTRGTVTLFGQEPRGQGPGLRRRVGYLPGDLPLWESLTGRETLRFLADLRGGVDWGYVKQLTDRFQVELNAPIRSLSRGNRQKIGVVSAFMHKPDLLVLDEPSGGLDPLMQQEFNALVRETSRAGATAFLSSHILPEVEALADRVGIIREGHLVAVETIGALKQRALRRMEVRFVEPPAQEAFTGLPGVRDLVVEGNVLRANVTPPMDAVIKVLAQFQVEDMVTGEPDLEDVFLTFYRTKQEGPAA